MDQQSKVTDCTITVLPFDAKSTQIKNYEFEVVKAIERHLGKEMYKRISSLKLHSHKASLSAFVNDELQIMIDCRNRLMKVISDSSCSPALELSHQEHFECQDLHEQIDFTVKSKLGANRSCPIKVVVEVKLDFESLFPAKEEYLVQLASKSLCAVRNNLEQEGSERNFSVSAVLCKGRRYHALIGTLNPKRKEFTLTHKTPPCGYELMRLKTWPITAFQPTDETFDCVAQLMTILEFPGKQSLDVWESVISSMETEASTFADYFSGTCTTFSLHSEFKGKSRSVLETRVDNFESNLESFKEDTKKDIKGFKEETKKDIKDIKKEIHGIKLEISRIGEKFRYDDDQVSISFHFSLMICAQSRSGDRCGDGMTTGRLTVTRAGLTNATKK